MKKNALHRFQMVSNRMEEVPGGFFQVEGKTND
jgi:hypothetical protein